MRTHWQFEHAGRVFSVKKMRRHSEQVLQGRQSRHAGAEALAPEHLVHVLKDPVRTQNLLVIRKADLHSPFGDFSAYSAFPSGDEEFVGFVRLTEHAPGAAYLAGTGVVGHALRKPASLAQLPLDAGRRGDSDAAAALSRAVSSGLADTPTPAGVRSWAYRGRRLGHLLTVLAEDAARAAGLREIYSSWSTATASHVEKHGWVVLKRKTGSLWCRKDLAPTSPEGIVIRTLRKLGLWRSK